MEWILINGMMPIIVLMLSLQSIGINCVQRDNYGCLYTVVKHNSKSDLFLIDTGYPTTMYDFNNGSLFTNKIIPKTDSWYDVDILRMKHVIKPINEDLTILRDVIISGSHRSVNGILGMDVISDSKIIIDLKSSTIISYDSSPEELRCISGMKKNSLLSDSSKFVYVKMIVKDEQFCLVVDTGCTHTAVDRKYRYLLSKIELTNQKYNGTGKDLPINTETGLIEKANLAGIEKRSLKVLIADLTSYSFIGSNIKGHKCIGMLGCDFIIDNSIILDLKNRCAYIK